MNDYKTHVSKFIRETKNKDAKQEVIRLYNYLTKDFATELAQAKRDYQLGLVDDDCEKRLLNKSYRLENQLRLLLGLKPLAPIDLSII